MKQPDSILCVCEILMKKKINYLIISTVRIWIRLPLRMEMERLPTVALNINYLIDSMYQRLH